MKRRRKICKCACGYADYSGADKTLTTIGLIAGAGLIFGIGIIVAKAIFS